MKDLFSIKTLLLEGGSVLNGAFQREGVIDELSLVMAPVAAGAESKPLFEDSQIETYPLKEVKQLENSVLWLNYIR